MEVYPKEAESILIERFGHDNVIALATIEDGVPHVRNVNAVYIDGAFYIITYALSNKIRQIKQNPIVAIAGEWFTAHGKGINLGFFGREEHAALAEKLKNAFASWIDNGHTDLQSENTCILCIKLTDALLLSHGTRYQMTFSE